LESFMANNLNEYPLSTHYTGIQRYSRGNERNDLVNNFN
jgi:hypothetical protein